MHAVARAQPLLERVGPFPNHAEQLPTMIAAPVAEGPACYLLIAVLVPLQMPSLPSVQHSSVEVHYTPAARKWGCDLATCHSIDGSDHNHSHCT